MQSTIAVLLILLFSACGDSLETVLSDKSWVISSTYSDKPIDLDLDGNKDVEIISQSPKCLSDDIFVFKANKELILDDSELICYEPKKLKGNWELSGNTLSIFLPNTSQMIFEITSFSEEKIVGTFPVPMDEEDFVFTYTFVRSK